jgi:hypothetical protein
MVKIASIYPVRDHGFEDRFIGHSVAFASFRALKATRDWEKGEPVFSCTHNTTVQNAKCKMQGWAINTLGKAQNDGDYSENREPGQAEALFGQNAAAWLHPYSATRHCAHSTLQCFSLETRAFRQSSSSC